MALFDDVPRNKRSSNDDGKVLHTDAPCDAQHEDKKFKADEYGRDDEDSDDDEDEDDEDSDDDEDEEGDGENVEEHFARQKRENEEFLVRQKEQYPAIHNHCSRAEDRLDDDIRFESPVIFAARNMIDTVLHSCNELCRKEPKLKDCRWIALSNPGEIIVADEEPCHRSKDESDKSPVRLNMFYDGVLENTKNLERIQYLKVVVNLVLNTGYVSFTPANWKQLKLKYNEEMTFAFDILYLPTHKISHMGLTKEKHAQISSDNYEIYNVWKHDLNPEGTCVENTPMFKKYYGELLKARKDVRASKPVKPSEPWLKFKEKSIAMFDKPLNTILYRNDMCEALQSYPFGYYEEVPRKDFDSSYSNLDSSYSKLPAEALIFRMNKHSHHHSSASADFIHVCKFVYERGWISTQNQYSFDLHKKIFTIIPDVQRDGTDSWSSVLWRTV